MNRTIKLYAVAAALLLLFSACSGGSSGGGTSNPMYTVSGVVSGLSGTVVLRDNGVDSLTIATNGTFTFSAPLASGATYSVTVKTQPSCWICTVANGTGTISGTNVTNVSVACAAGPAGMLDIAFGGTGMVTTSIGNYEHANAVAIQSDGKIVAVGQSDGNTTYNKFALTRYNTNGALDTTFGGSGKVTTAVGSYDAIADAVAIQSDGKIVVAGYAEADLGNGYGPAYFALVRYNTDGTLDTNFGSSGKVTTSIGAYGAQANAVAIQADGKIVAAGWSSSSSGYVFALVRYNANGTLDTTTFGSGTGKVTTAVDPTHSSDCRANAVAIQTDGSIVAAGTSANAVAVTGATSAFALVRYTSAGVLDITFNGSGIRLTAPTTGFNDANAVAIQSDGKIVAAGTSNSTDYQVALVRYNANGTLDNTFNTTGKVVVSFNSQPYYASAVAVQGNGKIVTAGYSGYATAPYVFSLVRFNSDGSRDTTFGTNGHVETVISGGPLSDYANGVAIQPDGNIVAAGEAGVNNTDFGLARYCQ